MYLAVNYKATEMKKYHVLLFNIQIFQNLILLSNYSELT